MKKYLPSLASLLLLFSLTACGAGGTPPPETTGEPEMSAPAESAPGPVPEETGPSASNDAAHGKTLVVYFSWSGNTRAVAEAIQTELDADIFEIATVDGYSEDYNTVLDEAQTEQKENARPELAASIEHFDQYDTVFFGFPNWWGDMPMAMYTVLDDYDFSGKTLIPFVTSGGSGFSDTLSAIAAAEPDADILDGLALSGSSVDSAGDQIKAWLDGLELA